MFRTNVLILLSGGIDSTACVAYYKAHKFAIHALFVDYGQAAAKLEFNAASLVCKHYRIPLKRIELVGGIAYGKGEILGRNAFLVNTALMNFEQKSGLISIGIHSGTNYWDCSEEFTLIMQRLLNAYTGGMINIDVPFLKWTKQDIWGFCLKEIVPIQLTYSCELGDKQPCGNCLSCKDLESLNANSYASRIGS